MARASRLSSARTAGPLGLALVLAVAAAHGTAADPSALLGTWTFQPGSNTTIQCGGVGPLSTLLGGTRAGIYPATAGSGGDVIFELGCHCRIALTLSATGAEITGPQDCTIINEAVETSGRVEVLTLSLGDGGALGFTLQGSEGQVMLGTPACTPGPFSGSGQLLRTAATATTCGDDATAVGVIPYSPNGNAQCVVGAGREGLRIQMHDEDHPPCSDETGAEGEGPWTLPDDERDRSPSCARQIFLTTLNFCRVDGARFRPITTGTDPNQYFAVLKLGTRCPAGSTEVSKIIDNEDAPGSILSRVIGDPGPNVVLADGTIGTVTTLVFCYFRAGASDGETMTAFPDLGFPYAVFHRYDGEQPPWVLAKHWQYSNDEDGQSAKDSYHGADSGIIEEFQRVIENPQDNTFYDEARVR